MMRFYETKYVWAGWALFVLSLLLPASHVSSTSYGWELWLMTIEVIGKVGEDLDNAQFALAGLANLIMVVSPLGMLITKRTEVRVIAYILVVSFFVALSFIQYYEIALVGYYVWLVSFIVSSVGFWLLSNPKASNTSFHPSGFAAG